LGLKSLAATLPLLGAGQLIIGAGRLKIGALFFYPQQGEGLALKQRTLPRKKPNAIDLILRIFASMAFVFLTPLPIRKVCHVP
jgi:hypothetical protein